MSDPVAFTPRALAVRWECSERHVRNLINRGELPFFRLGEKLVRVRQSAVEAFEQCQSIVTSFTAENGPSSITRTGSDSVAPSALRNVVIVTERSRSSPRITRLAKGPMS